MTKRQKTAFVLNIIALFLGAVGIIVRIVRDIPDFWLYYTQLSNVAAVISSAMYIVFRNTANEKLAALVRGARYLGVCSLTMTFVVVVLIFLPFGTAESADMLVGHLNGILHHFVCPVISLISYVWFEDGAKSRRAPLIPLIATTIYAFIVYTLNIFRLAPAPYPFFEVYDHPVWELVAWFVGLLIMTTAIAVVVRLGNIAARKDYKS